MLLLLLFFNFKAFPLVFICILLFADFLTFKDTYKSTF